MTQIIFQETLCANSAVNRNCPIIGTVSHIMFCWLPSIIIACSCKQSLNLKYFVSVVTDSNISSFNLNLADTPTSLIANRKEVLKCLIIGECTLRVTFLWSVTDTCTDL